MTLLAFRREPDSATIAHQAERQLRTSPYFFLKGISCQVEHGVLTLRGSVPFGSLRKFAEAIVLRVDGVSRVVNEIEVFDPERSVQRASGA